MISDPTSSPASATDGLGRVLVSIDGGVGRIELDNPARLNAISEAMWQALVDALAKFEGDADVGCVVICGAGERAFCSGADIAEKDRVAQKAPGERNKAALGALSRIEAFPKPVIAKISGYCLGAGLALAAACDLRVAVLGSTFGIPAAKLGLGLAYPVVQRLTELVGPSTTKRIIFTADRIGAQDALRFGLVDELAPAIELEATVRSLAQRIAGNAPLTIAAAKFAVATAVRTASERDLAWCAALERACAESADYAEGRRAFREKRAPRFLGR
jgi:enoyl-CoA hydratase/carnithine racemase